jgi:foldase protein PrsA
MVVDGRPVSREDFVDQLIEAHGLALAEQLILTTAARQRAEEMNLTVTDRDVREAHDDALRRMAMPLDADPDTPLDSKALEEARLLLEEFLLAKNISRLEWDLRMEQNAILRKIAEADVAQTTISEDMLRDEYEMAHGRRVQIRHIQLSSPQKVSEVRRRLQAGEDFELLARKFSENQITAARGGLLPPISRRDPAVTPLIRDAAFELDEGKVSLPVHEGNWFHILKVEQIFPPSNIPFENADHQALRRKRIDSLVRTRQEALEAELFQAASVDIRNEEIRRQFHRKHRQPDRR